MQADLLWFFGTAPNAPCMQAAIDLRRHHVTGTVRLKLYKGHVRTVGRWSEHSAIFAKRNVTFEE